MKIELTKSECDGIVIALCTRIRSLEARNDPEIYAAEPLWKWQESEAGKWVMENAVQTPSWHRHVDPSSFGWTYTIRAELTPKDYTFWWMKWGYQLTK